MEGKDHLNGGLEGHNVDSNIKDLLANVICINAKIDTLTNRLNRMNDKIYKHDNRLDLLEQRMSDTEDGVTIRNKELLRMEKILEVIKAKKQRC